MGGNKYEKPSPPPGEKKDKTPKKESMKLL